MDFRPCTECIYFIDCDFQKMIFHKATQIPCELFKEDPENGQDAVFEDVPKGGDAS